MEAGAKHARPSKTGLYREEWNTAEDECNTSGRTEKEEDKDTAEKSNLGKKEKK